MSQPSRNLICGVICAYFAILLYTPARASSAIWLPAPPTGDWNTATNWTPASVPNAPADTATFDLSTTTGVSLSADTEVNAITFTAAAINPFTITASPGLTLTISGVGITNNSAITHNFVTAVNAAGANGVILFTNGAAVAGAVAISNNGAAVLGAIGGQTTFLNTSSAGSATITNNAGTAFAAGGGVTTFFNTATASSATITNNAGTVSGANGGDTIFLDNSTAGSAMITQNGGAVSGAGGGEIFFRGTSTAGTADIFNNSGLANGSFSGRTNFTNTATAGSATINNNAGTSGVFSGGDTTFFLTSTAGSAIITNHGSAVSAGGGGETNFNNTSSAGNATISNNGGAVNAAVGGETNFNDSSSAGNATINNNEAAVVGAFSGRTRFFESSTAGSATINNNSAGLLGANAGELSFSDFSTAGSATIINHGATVFAAVGGSTVFLETSTAGSATIMTNGGSAGGQGGRTFFLQSSDGGTARAITNGNGSFDIGLLLTAGMGIGSIEGSGNYFLGSKTLTVGLNNLDTTVSGFIQDGGLSGGIGGALTKVGAGTLILTSNNTYTGGTTLNAGTLAAGAPSALGMGDVTVNGGLLRFEGANRNLSVPGNYLQSAGALSLRIGGTNEGVNTDLVSINGTATLGTASTLRLVQQNNFTLQQFDKITLITTNGGVFGTYGNVEGAAAFGNGTILQPTVTYDALNVYLELVRGEFGDIPGLMCNQQPVADNLDNAVGDPRAFQLITFLDNLLLTDLPNAFDLIAPEELTAVFEIAFSHATVQRVNLQRRMEDIRSGSTGFSNAGFAIRQSGKDYSGGKVSDGKVVLDKNPVPVMEQRSDNRWGVFVTGLGEYVDVGNDDSCARGYELRTGGLTVGADYRVSENFAIGLNAGYARSEADLVNDGNITVDAGKLGLYATYFSGGFYLDGAVGGGINSHDIRRAALLGDARGETDGSEFNAFLGSGYDWKFDNFRFGPTASLQYSSVNFDGFTESGSLAPLIIDDGDEDSFDSTLGFKISHDCKFGRAIVRPKFTAAWKHEFDGDRADTIDARLASGAGGVFTVRGPMTGRDSALIGGGATVMWNDRFHTYLHYDGEVGRDNYNGHNVSGGARVLF